MALRLFPDRRFPDRRFPEKQHFTDRSIELYKFPEHNNQSRT